jgi:two-component system cell cycle response regulator DivK
MKNSTPTPHHRILVVEDIDDIREMLVEIMALMGYQALTASNGVEAVAAAQRERPDLILMDVWLPLKNGTAAAREIRALPECAHIPIIRLSAFDEPLNLQGQPESFAWDAALAKPISIDLLEQTIRRLLAQPKAQMRSSSKLP